MKSIRSLPQAGWYAVCESDIATNNINRVILFDTPLIVLKSKDQKINVYIDACPHRGYPLSAGIIQKSGDLMCKYHGWCFNKEGNCTGVPGLENIPRFKLNKVNSHIYDGLVWVSLLQDKEFTLTHKRPALDHSFTWNYELDVPAYLLIENTLDPMHTPYIHAGLVRSETEDKKSVDIIIKNNNEFVEAIYKNEGGQSGLISKLFSPPNVDGIGRFINPGVLELEFKSPEKTYVSFTAYITPASESKINIILKTHYSRLPLRLDIIAAPIFKLILRKVVQQDIDVCLKQFDNLKRLPEFKYASSKVDYMIPYIDAFLDGKPKESVEREIKIII